MTRGWIALLLVVATSGAGVAQTTDTTTSTSTSSSVTTTTSSTTTTLKGDLACETALVHGLVTLSDGTLHCEARAAARTLHGKPPDEEGCLAPYQAAYECLSTHKAKDRFGGVRCDQPPFAADACPVCGGDARPVLPPVIQPLMADVFCGLNAPARPARRGAVRCGRQLSRRLAKMAVKMAACRIDEATQALAGVEATAPTCEEDARATFKTPPACKRTCLGLRVGPVADGFRDTLDAAVQQAFCACPRDAKGVLCGDDDPCTYDYCDGAVCRHIATAAATACADDGDPCTNDVCAQGVCTHATRADGELCDDKCSQCRSGQCARNSVSCVDTDPCTADTCDPTIGCVHHEVSDGTSCTADSNLCTDDWCVNGACVAHPKSCDDHDPTTQDECRDGICVYLPR